MVNHDVGLALKVIIPCGRYLEDFGLTNIIVQLFTDPKQTLVFDTRDLFNKLSRVNSDAADRFLESAVIQERDAASRLSYQILEELD